MVFVSVIIPFTKGRRYLKDCLDSLSKQNLKDVEIILVINGCNEKIDDLFIDFSNLIVKEFDDAVGVAKARNIALDIASGEYIYFLDGDDYLYEYAFDNLVEVARKTNADFINGERISTPYIWERFDEQLNKKSPLSKKNLSDLKFSIKLLVGTKTKREEVLSVLHALIKREKIEDIRFNDEKRYNSDYDFMIEAFPRLDTFIGIDNALYGKRSSDDPYYLPSLNQEYKENEFLVYAEEYQNVLESFKSYDDEKYVILKDEMAKKYFRFYKSRFASQFVDSPNNNWREINFDVMSEISKDFNTRNSKWHIKQEIKALQSKNKKIFSILVKSRYGIKKLKKSFSNSSNFNLAVYNKFYNNRKINDRQIMFESFMGNFYSDSPKHLYEYLYKNYGDKFDFVWVINDTSVKIPGNPKKVKRFSLEFYKELARSKYWVINGRQPGKFTKRPEQVIISTWHGTPLKKIGLDHGNVHGRNPRVKKTYIKAPKDWAYMISPNEYTTKILRSAFAYDGKIIQSGYPRNDILYNASELQIKNIKMDLKIPEDKKVVLYAPTFRDDGFYNQPGKVRFNLELDLNMLKEAIGDEYIILLRTHYFVADNLDLSAYEGFAFDVSRYNDIAELYLVSDILITDYSSVFFDFANLRRPMLFFTYDLDKYESELRGFYIDIHTEVPGPLLKTTEEVIDNIVNINKVTEEYADKYDEFYERFCSIEDGNASKRIFTEIWG